MAGTSCHNRLDIAVAKLATAPGFMPLVLAAGSSFDLIPTTTDI